MVEVRKTMVNIGQLAMLVFRLLKCVFASTFAVDGKFCSFEHRTAQAPDPYALCVDDAPEPAQSINYLHKIKYIENM